MARVTVEDCLEVVPSRFELVALAGLRAKHISSGASIMVERDNDKNTVISLREIADGKMKPEVLREQLIESFQKQLKKDDAEEKIDEISEDAEEIAKDMQANALGHGELEEQDEPESDISFDEDNLNPED